MDTAMTETQPRLHETYSLMGEAVTMTMAGQDSEAIRKEMQEPALSSSPFISLSLAPQLYPLSLCNSR